MIAEIREAESNALDYEIRAREIRRELERNAPLDALGRLFQRFTVTTTFAGIWTVDVAAVLHGETHAAAGTGATQSDAIREALLANATWHDRRASDFRELARELLETFIDVAA